MTNNNQTERNNNSNNHRGNILGGKSIHNTVTPSMFKNKETPNTTKRVFQPVQYTDDETKRIQGLLDKVLGPEYVSFRPGGGGQKVSYIEGWKALNLANEIFGFNGWSSELISSQVDYFDTHGNSGRYSMGLSVVVRITIKDGTYHEDFGYGYIDNAKNKAMAFEKCRKEAFTDGLKRCLRCFGNVLGNCLYDRNIISKIQKVKSTPINYEDDDFYRDSRVAERNLIKKESTRVNILEKPNNGTSNNSKEDREFQVPHPQTTNSTMPPNHSNNNNTKGSTGARDGNTKKDSRHPGDAGESKESRSHQSGVGDSERTGKSQDIRDFDDSFVFSDDFPMEDLDDLEMNHSGNLDEYDMEMLLHKNEHTEASGTAHQAQSTGNAKSAPTGPRNPPTLNNRPAPQDPNFTTPVQNKAAPASLFVSAKKADILQNTSEDIDKIPRFDTKFISPNIRRTIDPTKSIPIKRTDATATSRPNATISSTATTSSSQISNNQTPLSSQNTNQNTLSKRMVGLPPSSHPPIKRLHRDVTPNSALDSESSKDKENRSIA